MQPYTLLPVTGHYDYIGQFHEGRAFVRNNAAEFRAGYIDRQGKESIPLRYYGRFQEKNLYIILASGKAGPLC